METWVSWALVFRSTTSSFVTLICRWFCSYYVSKLSTIVLYSVSSPPLMHMTIGASTEKFWRWQDSGEGEESRVSNLLSLISQGKQQNYNLNVTKVWVAFWIKTLLHWHNSSFQLKTYHQNPQLSSEGANNVTVSAISGRKKRHLFWPPGGDNDIHKM